MPRIHDTIDALSGNKYYTTVDLLAGFWQTPMEESLKQYTAFTVDMLGFFQCERMPFGLCNTPATFSVFDDQLSGRAELLNLPCIP